MRMNGELQLATEIVKNGGIIIFPTDTAFGVGCKMDDSKAVKRLFKIRQRPKIQATPVLVDSMEMAQKYLQPISEEVKNLMQKYWPGALTIILQCRTELVPSAVRGGGQTLGVRMPNHEIPLSIINSIGVPILGPSANFHGAPTPYKFADLDQEFTKLVDGVIPDECSVGMASTIIDCSVRPWKIVRQGKVKLNPLKLFIDTSDNQKTIVRLDGDRLEKTTGPDKSQQVLVLIDEILKKNKKMPNEITEIEIKTGPGSFTGLRVGAAVANALAFALQIPVNGKKLETNLHYR